MAFHNWSMKSERIQKKSYIYTCRKIVKAMVRHEWIEPPPEGKQMSWDHVFSCQIAYLSHLPLNVANCPMNLELIGYKENNRKGTRCYQGVDLLIEKWEKWPDKVEFTMWLNEYENKWGISFSELIQPIIV